MIISQFILSRVFYFYFPTDHGYPLYTPSPVKLFPPVIGSLVLEYLCSLLQQGNYTKAFLFVILSIYNNSADTPLHTNFLEPVQS